MNRQSLSMFAVALPLLLASGGCAMQSDDTAWDDELIGEQSEALTSKPAVAAQKPGYASFACPAMIAPVMIYELSLPESVFGQQKAYLVTEIDTNKWSISPAQRIVWTACPLPSKPGTPAAVTYPPASANMLWDYGAWVGLSNAHLAGKYTPTCDIDSSVTGQFDVRYALAPNVTVADACSALKQAGHPCVPCSGGAVACVDTTGMQVAGPISGPVAPTSVPSYVCN